MLLKFKPTKFESDFAIFSLKSLEISSTFKVRPEGEAGIYLNDYM